MTAREFKRLYKAWLKKVRLHVPQEELDAIDIDKDLQALDRLIPARLYGKQRFDLTAGRNVQGRSGVWRSAVAPTVALYTTSPFGFTGREQGLLNIYVDKKKRDDNMKVITKSRPRPRIQRGRYFYRHYLFQSQNQIVKPSMPHAVCMVKLFNLSTPLYL